MENKKLQNCVAVSIYKCDHADDCDNCGMLEYLFIENEEEREKEFIKNQPKSKEEKSNGKI